jgi:acetyl esterase/lipase
VRGASVSQSSAPDSDNATTAHAFYYPPHNADYEDAIQNPLSLGRERVRERVRAPVAHLRSKSAATPPPELPPLIVMSHGGPTSATSPAFSLRTQYWTSRGFAVLDVNYGGSTGYGREYRNRLAGNWGIVDVEDCVNGARYLVEQGLVDGERLAITGGSAGGYTTLAALAFHDTFKAGASHYGVADLEALARDTHKFESRYLDGLIGPYHPRQISPEGETKSPLSPEGKSTASPLSPEGKSTASPLSPEGEGTSSPLSPEGESTSSPLSLGRERVRERVRGPEDAQTPPHPPTGDPYFDRSPIHHVDGLSCPVIFFQGLEDEIVPPNQAETMVAALRAKGVPVAYLPFPGEQHGFRRAENIKRSLEAELYFYGRIFGFEPSDEIEPVAIDNLYPGSTASPRPRKGEG